MYVSYRYARTMYIAVSRCPVLLCAHVLFFSGPEIKVETPVDGYVLLTGYVHDERG